MFYTEKILSDGNSDLGHNSDEDRTSKLLQESLEGLNSLSLGDPQLSGHLVNLLVLFGHYYGMSMSVDHLEAALKYAQAGMDATPEGQTIHSYRLQGFAVLYGEHYKRTGAIQDLKAALKCGHAALDMTPEGHPYMLT